MSIDLSAYANLTAHRAVADHEFLCDWVAADHLGGHDWCPTVLEPGDDYTLVLLGDQVAGRYCLGCGYHLFGTPELEPAPARIA
jgi:threonine dehydrogenase-like Zn-dependent dehydrogenase